jgi:tripartite-type tricarboxylate transporter receptor subunit TctC
MVAIKGNRLNTRRRKMAALKKVTRLFAAGAMLACAAMAAAAGKYPDKPIRLVVPFSAGGQFDIAARMLGQFASRELGQPVIVDNSPGGGGNIGAAKVALAPADGYTLLTLGGNHAIAHALYAKPGYNITTDFTPISMVTVAPHVVLVNSALPVNSFNEFVAYAKSSPGTLSYGSPGIGTSMHLTFEMIKANYGIDVLHVPYKGGANMLADLAAGQIKAGIVALAPAREFIATGRVRPLAVTSKTRSPALPDVPSLAELGYPALDAGSWMGLAGPKNLPPDVVQRWNGIVHAFLADPASRKKLEGMAFRLTPGSPADFDKLLRSEVDAYGKVVRDNRIMAE